MNINDLKRILTSFADKEDDVLFDKGKILATIRGEDITLSLTHEDGELCIAEGNVKYKPKVWISSRLAQLPQLAQRIIDYTPPIDGYVNPTGKILNDIETDPSETETSVDNVTECLQECLNTTIPGTTSITYLTSDAGEGKTTIINQLAINQANYFKLKKSSWLLVPIPLGGRPFLRFDDIVVASLVNRLRFRNFYYESFIELIQLGLIVPAFDGFEEMFMDSSTGEALSATGQLMNKLNSSGNVLIAARQAFFEYKSFTTQAKLFDTISSNSVTFSKVSIDRWSKSQFIEYAQNRGIENSENIFNLVSKKLQSDNHPILTRPVLVHQLLDVFSETSDYDEIIEAFESASSYFPNFVDVIIKREAESKWIDTSGEPYKPLLTTEQHYQLLALVAEEMWLNSTDSLQDSILDVICDMYGDTNKMPPHTTRQIKERLKQHALITLSENGNRQYKFDHDEFKDFFLGIAVFSAIQENRTLEFKNLMRKGILLNQTINTITALWKKNNPNVKEVIANFQNIQKNENPTSFVKENCGNIILRLLDTMEHESIELFDYNFNSKSLEGIALENLNFKKCHFQSTSFSQSSLSNCTFENCSFDLIEIDSDHISIEDCSMLDCVISSLRNKTTDSYLYDPDSIVKEIEKLGISTQPIEEIANSEQITKDEDLTLVEKALRKFARTTHINDALFRMRLANQADYFTKNLLPTLLDESILIEVDYQGGGQKRRFKLGKPLEKVNYALINSNGKFDTFLEKLRE